MWSDCDKIDRRTFFAALTDWARYQRQRWGHDIPLWQLRGLRKEFHSEPGVLFRAVHFSIETESEAFQLEPRDREIRSLRERNAILEAANQLRERMTA